MNKVDVPTGKSGDWSVERFEVSEKEANFFNLRESINAHRGCRFITPGTYTKLVHLGNVIMSDTPAEMTDHNAPVRMAKGRILINGLGLGMVLQACLEKDEVEYATVIEKSPDVVNLVGLHYKGKFGGRVQIILDDAFTYKPPKGVIYDMVWHDIWADICPDNLGEITKLRRKYARRCKWQDAWCARECARALRCG